MQTKTIDTMTIFICGLVILSILCMWLFISINMWIKFIISLVLLFSLYYQFMTSRQGLSHVSIVTSIEDRIMNEVAYQVIKRGYYIKFEIKEKENINDYKKPSAKWLKYSMLNKFTDIEDNVYLSVEKCNMPKNKRKLVKLISFINVVLRPAWAYREFEEEEDIMYNKEKHKDLVNLK